MAAPGCASPGASEMPRLQAGEHLAPDVSAEVEMRIVHPDRVGEVPRHAMDALPVARHQVDPLFDRFLDAKCASPAGNPGPALEHVDGADVERCLCPFGVEKPGVARRERLVVRRDPYPGPHGAIV